MISSTTDASSSSYAPGDDRDDRLDDYIDADDGDDDDDGDDKAPPLVAPTKYEDYSDYDDDDDDDDIEVVATKAPPAATTTKKGPPPSATKPVPSVVSAKTPSITVASARPTVSSCWTPAHLKCYYTDYDAKEHCVLVILMPSGTCVHNSDDISVGVSAWNCTTLEHESYLTLSFTWPEIMANDHGQAFLGALKTKRLHKMLTQKLGRQLSEEQLKKQFEALWVMLEMAIKNELTKKHKESFATIIQSQTTIKLDFNVERITEDDWELIGDNETGIRLLVIDLEEATPMDETTPMFGRKVDFILNVKPAAKKLKTDTK